MKHNNEQQLTKHKVSSPKILVQNQHSNDMEIKCITRPAQQHILGILL